MRTLRTFVAMVVATALAASAAWAVTYDEIFELTAQGVTERAIVQLIADDGRAFQLGDSELAELRAAGVSERVIEAMIDPGRGEAWLLGDDFGPWDDAVNPYATPLDRVYSEGDGVRSTALVYSFGYYYGPLSRYYYDDPYYYPFWFGGYAYAYWPSYYAYGWRPADDEYYAYPYNYYDFTSYYCHAYYDPGYWTEIGYTVQPGAGRTVWDQGPRFRDGGIVPPKGGRPDAVTADAVAAGSAARTREAVGPPAIREAEGGGKTSDYAARARPDAGWGEAPAGAARGATRAYAAPKPRSIVAEAEAIAKARRDQRARAAEQQDWIRQQNERWAQWQEQLKIPVPETASEESRRREPASAPPPPPPPPPPAEPEKPRNEERPERAPAPPPPPPAPPAPAPADERDPPAGRRR